MESNVEDKYGDMIYMEHHVSKNHPQMPMSARAGQFAPFSALQGYEDAIEEAEKKYVSLHR